MQIQIKAIEFAYKRKSFGCGNMMSVAFILLPLLLFSFYSNPMVFSQDETQSHSPKDILICQISEYIESPIGSNTQQAANICSYQNSIGYNQSLSELCFIFSGKGIDVINSYCDKNIPTETSTPMKETSTPMKETSTPMKETNRTLNNQNNTNNELKVTIFDGVSKFFTGIFNP
jgi:hypothetical protein